MDGGTIVATKRAKHTEEAKRKMAARWAERQRLVVLGRKLERILELAEREAPGVVIYAADRQPPNRERGGGG